MTTIKMAELQSELKEGQIAYMVDGNTKEERKQIGASVIVKKENGEIVWLNDDLTVSSPTMVDAPWKAQYEFEIKRRNRRS